MTIKIEFKKEILHLHRTTENKEEKDGNIDIPSIILHGQVPLNAKVEIEEFFDYVIKKYGLQEKKKRGRKEKS